MTKNTCVQLDVGSKSDIGRVRKNNEDICRILQDLKLFIVSDGMGGETHGELASSVAGDAIVACCSEPPGELLSTSCDPLGPDLAENTNRLVAAVRFANHRIYQTALESPELHGMGATVVAAWLEGARLSLVHVGDSRAYLLHFGVLERLTADHTVVAEQVRRGLIKPEQAHLSKMQNVLMRALGVQDKVVLEATERTLVNGDILLLCTDGLTRMVEDTEIAQALLESSDAQLSADHLVNLANEHGGEDNVSVIVVHFAEVP